jgi:hypothetical protein
MTQILNALIASTGCSREQAISALIAQLVEDGATVVAAVDAVLGAGTYETLAGEVYDGLRAA